MNYKLKKVLIILAIILVVEVIAFFIYKNFIDNEDIIVKYSYYNDVLVENNDYLAVGYNNYYQDERAYYHDGELMMQGQIIKFDKDLKEIKEANYHDEGSVFLMNVIKANDGYIAIGSRLVSDSLVKGLILKYDNDLNFVKKQEYNLLNMTMLRNIVKDGDNYIIIGSSIYENDRIGNHLGGGIILKIDNDLNILEHNNYGGNKSGSFDNIIVFDDYYLVSGIDADHAIIIKFDKNFNRDSDDVNPISKKVIFNKTFDEGIDFFNTYYYQNKLYNERYVYDLDTNEIKEFNGKDLNYNNVLLISEDKIYTNHYEHNNDNKSLIYVYNLDMEKINEYKIDIEEINKLINYDDKLLVIGRIVDKDSSIKPIIKFVEK